jgi:hypothetical protein
MQPTSDAALLMLLSNASLRGAGVMRFWRENKYVLCFGVNVYESDVLIVKLNEYENN